MGPPSAPAATPTPDAAPPSATAGSDDASGPMSNNLGGTIAGRRVSWTCPHLTPGLEISKVPISKQP